MICVTGGTGTVGRELVRALRARGASFTVMARDPDAASRVLGADVALRRGAFEDDASMRAAFQGSEQVFLLCAPGPAMDTLEIGAVRAARDSGVRKIVKISAPGASPHAPAELLRMHGRSEAAIESSGLAWTHLQPNGFMQNLWGPTQGLRRDGTFRLSVRDGRVPMIDATDIAAVAAEVLVAGSHDRTRHHLTGPDAPTYDDVARVFSELLGRPIAYHAITGDECRDLFLSEGLPAGLVGELIGYFELIARGHASQPTSAVLDIAGRPPKSLRQFVAEHLDRFVAILES